ncbi:MAG: hypothetical protein LQ342_004873 [Letrouitia transgressa]|nr:MAG: hypothetical protein LQ342_004873 [Letrouitia transgressa]
MAPSVVAEKLRYLEDQDTPLDKATEYNSLLTQIASNSQSPDFPTDLIAFVDSILGESLGIVTARPLLGSAVEVIQTITNVSDKIEVGTHALRILEPQVVSFDEQDAAIREILADAYTAQDDYKEAAMVLQGIQLDSSQRRLADDYKVRIWVRICRLFLEEDDPTSAERYLNRAKNLRHKVKDQELILQFQLSEARILDARRRFLEASHVYHTFSFSTLLEEEERTRALSSAIVCAVLAPAGPQRSRALAKLYKDERSQQVNEFGILEKMFLDRLLSPSEVARFADNLAPHQLARTADGSTVLAKAVVEHNLLSVSKLYSRIGVNELGNFLGLNAEKAEEYAARMLEQGRITGCINQIDGFISFEGREAGAERGSEGLIGHSSRVNLRKWDYKVQGIAEEVEQVASMIHAHHPVLQVSSN